MGFNAKHIAITGAAGAIGGALAKRYRALFPDARLSLLDMNKAACEALADELSGNVQCFECDLTEIDALPSLWQQVSAKLLPVDVLVNSAGVMDVITLEGMDWQHGRKLLDINLTAPLRLMDLALPDMIAQGKGSIINLSSMAGNVPIKGCVYYGAGKAGIGMASEIARMEVKAKGVNILTVYPGPIFSALESHARAQVETGFISRFIPTGQPDAIAKRIIQAFEKDQARVIYPDIYGVANKVANMNFTFGFMSWFSPQPNQ